MWKETDEVRRLEEFRIFLSESRYYFTDYIRIYLCIYLVTDYSSRRRFEDGYMSKTIYIRMISVCGYDKLTYIMKRLRVRAVQYWTSRVEDTRANRVERSPVVTRQNHVIEIQVIEIIESLLKKWRWFIYQSDFRYRIEVMGIQRESKSANDKSMSICVSHVDCEYGSLVREIF